MRRLMYKNFPVVSIDRCAAARLFCAGSALFEFPPESASPSEHACS